MTRFYHGKKEHYFRRLIFSVLFFCCIAACFYIGVDSVFSRTKEEQKKSLEEAIQRGITHCYAVEGRYPQSLEYLKKEYGIQYDNHDFFVDYQIAGANIAPDVTIIEK